MFGARAPRVLSRLRLTPAERANHRGRLVTELLGTFSLVTLVQLCSAHPDPALTAPGVVVGLIALIYAGAPISAAHYNPAVSLAFTLRGACSPALALSYLPCQLLGGAGGAFFGAGVAGRGVRLARAPHVTLRAALAAEMFFTALLCFVVMATATSARIRGNEFYGYAIAGVVFAGIVGAGPVSGAAFNPAVAFGLALANDPSRTMCYAFAVSAADLTAAALGTALFYVTDRDQWIAGLEKDAPGGAAVSDPPSEETALLS